MNHANIMRGYRKFKSLNQEQTAKALGVSQSVVSKVENGVLDITVEAFEIIFFEVTGVPLVSYLLETASVGHDLLEKAREARKERRKNKKNKKSKPKKKPRK